MKGHGKTVGPLCYVSGCSLVVRRSLRVREAGGSIPPTPTMVDEQEQIDLREATDEQVRGLVQCPKCNRRGLHLVQEVTGREGFAHVVSLRPDPENPGNATILVREGCKLDLGGQC